MASFGLCPRLSLWSRSQTLLSCGGRVEHCGPGSHGKNLKDAHLGLRTLGSRHRVEHLLLGAFSQSRHLRFIVSCSRLARQGIVAFRFSPRNPMTRLPTTPRRPLPRGCGQSSVQKASVTYLSSDVTPLDVPPKNWST